MEGKKGRREGERMEGKREGEKEMDYILEEKGTPRPSLQKRYNQ